MTPRGESGTSLRELGGESQLLDGSTTTPVCHGASDGISSMVFQRRVAPYTARDTTGETTEETCGCLGVCLPHGMLISN